MPTIEEIPARPPAASSPSPRIDTTPDRTKTHKRKASLVSPIAITASSPAARRMSRRGTPQAAMLEGDSVLGQWATVIERRAGLVAAVCIVGIVLTGTTYAELYSLALNTSFSLVPSIERTGYFAQKSNPFNQYGVKLSWLHTSVAYLLHLFTSPSSRPSPSSDTHGSTARRTSHSGRRRATRSKQSRLWSYLLTSVLWFAFTSWFFGYGLGDRVIQLSGGKCVIPIPQEWEIEQDGVQAVLSHVPISVGAYMLPEEMSERAAGVTKDTSLKAGSSVSADSTVSDRAARQSNPILLGVPPHLCVQRQPLSPKNKDHRDIFAILTHLPFPPHLKNLASASASAARTHPGAAPGLTIPRPRWYKGHDISGHTVALTIASLLLVRELAPTWASWLRAAQAVLGRSADQPALMRQRTSSKGDLRELGHGIATVLASTLLGLWVFMLGVTAVYFHSPEEKLSGLALGLGISLLTYLLSPGSSRARSSSSAPKSTATLAPTFDSSDEDTIPSDPFSNPQTGRTATDENTARRLAAEALAAAEKDAEEVAEAQRAMKAEMDAVLAGKEKAA